MMVGSSLQLSSELRVLSDVFAGILVRQLSLLMSTRLRKSGGPGISTIN